MHLANCKQTGKTLPTFEREKRNKRVYPPPCVIYNTAMIAISQWFFRKKIEKSPKKVPKSRVFSDKMQKTATHMDNSVKKLILE